MRRPPRKSAWRHLVWIIPLLVLDFYLFRWLALRQGGCTPTTETPTQPAQSAQSEEPLPPPPPPPVWQAMVPPTPQTNLLNPDAPGVLQPTGSGRLDSAKFGSTRTGSRNGRIFPSFHEGVDIAATQRDRKGAATDPVFAVAAGRVAFVNPHAGNSSYGKYVVLEHPDDSLGTITRRDGTVDPATVYTLYAHLADIRFGIRAGHSVKAGDEIGTMGATSNTRPPIPLARAHLHWEVGVMLNARFEIKAREEKLVPNFGNYNGGNLFGFDPLDFYAAHVRNPDLTMAAYLAQLPVAYEVALRGKSYPDYFRRFPKLWHGKAHNGGPIRLTVSESGAPLSGRNATDAEIARLGNQRQVVLKAYPDVLGRNGRAYISLIGSQWKFTAKGRQWADILFY